ncbi:MAG: methyltransferase domain-containing protein [Lewinellaceae bacterium]|nr:methyltransferase domain-containing protein [Lewinellaceae bacterium]
MDNISTYYDALAPDYDQSRFGNAYGQFIHRQERQVLAKLLRGISPEHVLDLACGTGRMLEFAETGCDFSTQMLAEARQKHPSKNLIHGEATQLPFANEAFNAIFSLHFFMHLDTVTSSGVLDEAYRVLRPGGRLIFDFPSQKRRKITGGHHGQNWHGSNEMSLEKVSNLTANYWQVVESQGVLFFPIHRIPASLRIALLPFDTVLCQSFLKEYASYVLVCLQKK